MIPTRTVLTALLLALALTLPAGVATADPAGPAAGGPAVGAEASGPSRTFLTFNVAGRIQNDGQVDPVASHLVRVVRKREPYAAALQEVCGRQAFAVDRRLERYRMVFFPTGIRCSGGQGFGNAVLIRNGPVTKFRSPIPTGGEGKRNIGCLTRTSPRLAVCSTHLSAGSDRADDRQRQAARVAQIGERYVRDGFPTFVSGDFNDIPTTDRLDLLYRPAYGQGARGIFTESEGCCARDGDPTLGEVKFDYGFLSYQWRLRRSFVADAEPSDHRMLWTIMRRK